MSSSPSLLRVILLCLFYLAGRFGLGLGPDVYTAGQKKVRAIPRKKKAAPKGDEDGKLGGEDGEEAAGGDEGEQGEEGEQEEAEEGGEGEEEGAAPPAQFGLGPAIVRPGDWIDVHSKVKAGLLDPNDLIAARAPNTGGHIPTAPELGNVRSLRLCVYMCVFHSIRFVFSCLWLHLRSFRASESERV